MLNLKKIFILHAFLKSNLYFFFSFFLFLYYAVKQKIYGFYNASSTIHSRIKKTIINTQSCLQRRNLIFIYTKQPSQYRNNILLRSIR